MWGVESVFAWLRVNGVQLVHRQAAGLRIHHQGRLQQQRLRMGVRRELRSLRRWAVVRATSALVAALAAPFVAAHYPAALAASAIAAAAIAAAADV